MSDLGTHIRIRLPIVLSDDPGEVGVARDADGHGAFAVNTKRTWSDATACSLATFLLSHTNAGAPPPAEAAERLASALDSVRAPLVPIAEERNADFAALRIAGDALADFRVRARTTSYHSSLCSALPSRERR